MYSIKSSIYVRKRSGQADCLVQQNMNRLGTGWINVLDQFVLMFGDKNMKPVEAARILDEGFDSLEFARIPPSLDQVTVSTVEISSLMEIDAVFVLGVNDGVMPKRMDNEGILSDADREWFCGNWFRAGADRRK